MPAALALSFLMNCACGAAFAADKEADEASADFGTGSFENMSVKMGQGDPVSAERDGKYGWVISSVEDNTAASSIYIDLAEGFAGSKQDGNTFEVEVDYFDEDRALFSLLYNSWEKENYMADVIVAESTGWFGSMHSIKQWKTAKFFIQDGNFNEKSSSSDIIISANNFNRNTLDEKTVNEFGKTYASYYLNRYGRVSSDNPIVIGGVRVKKLPEKNPFSVKVNYDFKAYTIFDDDEIKGTYTIQNIHNEGYRLGAKYIIRDGDGAAVKETDEDIDVNAHETKEINLDLGTIDRYGELSLTLEFAADGILNRTTVPLIHCRESKEANPRLGANVHFEGADRFPQMFDEEYELLKRGGYSSARDSMRWAQIEKSPGIRELTPMLQKEYDYSKKYGIDILTIADIDADLYGDQSSPETLEKFEEQCAWLAEKYKGVSEWIESDNEWNLHRDAGIEIEDYINLIKATYNGIKRGNPDMKLMGGDWGGYIMKDFRTICETGGLDYMDGFSYHVYFSTKGPADAGTFTQGEAVKNLLKEFGHEDMPLFLTENGWTDNLAQSITLEDEAMWHAQLIMQNSAWKTFDKIYPYEFQNSGVEKSYQEAMYGVTYSPYDTYPGRPKPAYITTATANWALGGAEFEDAADGMDATSSHYIYKYKRKNDDGLGNNMIALWTIEDRAEIGLRLGTDELKMFDMYGNKTVLRATDGVFSFAASQRPIYLIGDFSMMEMTQPTVKTNGLIFNGTTDDTVIQTIEIPGADGAKIIPSGSRFFATSESTGFTGNTASYIIKTPGSMFYNKRSEYDIVKDGKTLYHGDIRVNSADTVTINAEHKICDSKLPNRWELTIDITNNKNSSPVSGKININNPKEFSRLMSGSFTDLKPQETKHIKFFMPEIVTKEMRPLDITVQLTDGKIQKLSKRMFFTIVPYAYEKPVVDGKASSGEYSSDTWFDIKAGEKNGTYSKTMYESLYNSGKMHMGDDDLSAKATMKYDEENIWFFIDVKDDIFVNNYSDSMSWNGDSIQLGITDESIKSGSRYAELTIALTPDGPQIYRNGTNNTDNPIGPVEDKELAIERDGNHTRYEIRLPWKQVLNDASKVKAGYRPKFALLINEDDGSGRNSYLEYSQTLGAIGTYKNVSYFSDMILAK